MPNSNESARGFSILEILLSIVIASIAVGATINAFNSILRIGSKSATRNSIEEVIGSDLGWIRSYAKAWKLKSGPYNHTTAITKTDTYTNSPYLEYDPNAGVSSCSSGLAASFISDASSVNLTPSRPQPIPEASGSSQSLALPSFLKQSGHSVSRTITFDSAPNSTTIRITYSIAGPFANDLGISRQAEIYLEAASWCSE